MQTNIYAQRCNPTNVYCNRDFFFHKFISTRNVTLLVYWAGNYLMRVHYTLQCWLPLHVIIHSNLHVNFYQSDCIYQQNIYMRAKHTKGLSEFQWSANLNSCITFKLITGTGILSPVDTVCEPEREVCLRSEGLQKLRTLSITYYMNRRKRELRRYLSVVYRYHCSYNYI